VPPLEELEKTVRWIDRPVLDAMELRREAQEGEKPLVSVEEALKIKNNSPKDNEKILSALGRLPEAEEDANFDAVINRHLGGDLNSTNPILSSSAIESEVLGLTSFGWTSDHGTRHCLQFQGDHVGGGSRPRPTQRDRQDCVG
jgi:peptide/nickel transport system substrate-binding protein